VFSAFRFLLVPGFALLGFHITVIRFFYLDFV